MLAGANHVRYPLRVFVAGDNGPRDDHILRLISCPFDVGQRDPAMNAIPDRIDDSCARNRRNISIPLNFQLFLRHGERYIDRKDEFYVHNFLRGGGRDEQSRQGDSCSKSKGPEQPFQREHADRISPSRHQRIRNRRTPMPAHTRLRERRTASGAGFQILRIVERPVTDRGNLDGIGLAEILDNQLPALLAVGPGQICECNVPADRRPVSDRGGK